MTKSKKARGRAAKKAKRPATPQKSRSQVRREAIQREGRERAPRKRAAPRARPGEVGVKTAADVVAVKQNGGGDAASRSNSGEKPDEGAGGAPPNLSTIPAGPTQPGALATVKPAPSGAQGKATIETDAQTVEGTRPSGQLADSQ